ncbi:ABC1 family-domain-containing protein [Gorgonomyces haynaldii]|nr:ABC1 family-domain-containing protein [Gorgonomyces haynaldii]
MKARYAVPLVGLAGFFVYDNAFNYSTFTRNIKTVYTAAIVAIDYKINFNKEKSNQIAELHSRTATKIFELCKANGGLYIKFGQQLAGVPLPESYVQLFRQLYDKAPWSPYEVVEKIIQQELGKHPLEIFETFTPYPVASASIAQVHKATLKTGETVAVKIQKPEIKAQIYWDLMVYKLLMHGIEWIFDLPVAWSADYIRGHIMQETDFVNEAQNAEKAWEGVREEPLFRNTVYVPQVHWDLTTRRVMTAEWIEGTPLVNVEDLKVQGHNLHTVMTLVVKVFADQIFRTGFVHCDPHPGNILVRKHPKYHNTQVVLLDHGLYVQSREQFRQEYALFWKSLFTLDLAKLDSIAASWGLPDVAMFATATLARPWKRNQRLVGQKVNMTDAYEAHSRAKARMVEFLQASDKLPKELIFIGRNLNCIRANNKYLGSPVNRINIMADWAVKSLGTRKSNTLRGWVAAKLDYVTFQTTLAIASIGFSLSTWFAQVLRLIGFEHKGFEQVMDDAMKRQLEEQVPGIKFDDQLFE